MKVKLGELYKIIDKLEKYQKSLKEREKRFLTRVGELGVSIGQTKFQSVQYDGDTSDFDVRCEWKSDDKIAVVFSSKAILFIEFGAGVHYSSANDIHPLASKKGYKRGEYGMKKGKGDWWLYRGEGGTPSTANPNMKITHGNPANRIVYGTGKELREMILQIAKEEFRFD
jgi:hypothetical protein